MSLSIYVPSYHLQTDNWNICIAFLTVTILKLILEAFLLLFSILLDKVGENW